MRTTTIIIPTIDVSYREGDKDLRREKDLANDADPTPIHKFASTYGIPHSVANLLIGKTEEETDRNICVLSECIDAYVNKKLEEGECPTTRVTSAQTPYGWGRIDGKLVQIPEEQKVLEIIVAMYHDKKTPSDIKTYLDEHNYPTRHGIGEGWQACVVGKILDRELARRGIHRPKKRRKRNTEE